MLMVPVGNLGMIRGKLALGILVQTPQSRHTVGTVLFRSAFCGFNHAQVDEFAVSSKVRIKWENAAAERPQRIDAAAVVASEKTATPAPVTQDHDAAPGAQRHEVRRFAGQVDVTAADPFDDVDCGDARIVYDAMQVRVRQRQKRITAAIAATGASKLQ